MSSCDSSSLSHLKCKDNQLSEGCEDWEDENRRLKRREKNRVSARKSRKRQTQRADILHQMCELLEQKNMKLRKEVDSLSEEQRLLNDTLKAHEPLCLNMHCFITSSTSSGLQPDTMEAQSV
uniref:basic leucine zipper transcriptional factor ATF-like 3 n=1 Tax=Semicossyphus pulcher TaxID=241346 RepID=UPI0037E902EE